MRALFANYFCHFLPKTFLGFVLHIAYVYGIDKIAYRHLKKTSDFLYGLARSAALTLAES